MDLMKNYIITDVNMLMIKLIVLVSCRVGGSQSVLINKCIFLHHSILTICSDFSALSLISLILPKSC